MNCFSQLVNLNLTSFQKEFYSYLKNKYFVIFVKNVINEYLQQEVSRRYLSK